MKKLAYSFVAAFVALIAVPSLALADCPSDETVSLCPGGEDSASFCPGDEDSTSFCPGDEDSTSFCPSDDDQTSHR